MNNELLLKESQNLIRKYFGPAVPQHDERAGVSFYAHDKKLNYIHLGIVRLNIRYKISSTDLDVPKHDLALAFSILARAEELMKDEPVYAAPVLEDDVELTLDDIAKLKGVDVKRIKVVEESK